MTRQRFSEAQIVELSIESKALRTRFRSSPPGIGSTTFADQRHRCRSPPPVDCRE